jgi:four helix bundle protein
MRLVNSLPASKESEVLGKQALRSGTSVAANYRAVGLCRTKAEFVNKLRIVLEEADETVYWLECIRESGLVRPDKLTSLLDEAMQLTAIFTASLRTARGQGNADSKQNPDCDPDT